MSITITLNKTQNMILEVIANHPEGLKSIDVKNWMDFRGKTVASGTVAAYLKYLTDSKLVNRVAKRTNPNEALSYVYRTDYTEVTP
jgi:Fe2+ or Zn2+ uptake regulation protein